MRSTDRIKREDKRLLNNAISLVAAGAKLDPRLRNVLKGYAASPDKGYGITHHDIVLFRKFVEMSTTNVDKPKVNGGSSSLSHEDKALIAKSLSYRESKPPADVRLKIYLDGVRKSSRPLSGSNRIGDHTRGMLRKYIEQCERPGGEKLPKKKFTGPQQLGLGLSSELEMITPEIAFSMLEVNERIGFHNRNINRERVAMYTDDMKAGRWRNTAEPLLIGKDGQLMNGQHRLHAVIDAEVSVPMLIIRGVDLDAFFSIDQGRPRKPSDVVSIVGIRSSALTAATLKLIWAWEHFGSAGVKAGPREHKGFTNEIAAEMAKARDIHDSVLTGQKMSKLAPPSAIAFCHWLCGTKNKSLADDFFSKLHSGENLKRGDPLLVLRQRLIAERSDPTSSVRRIAVIRMVMRIWNAVRKNQVLMKMPPTSDEVDRPL